MVELLRLHKVLQMLSRLIIKLKKLYNNNSMTTLIHAFAGNIGIGTTDPGAYKLRVEGAAKMDSLQVNGVTNSHVPIGLISMWYGTIGTIPTGWHVCDGTTGISRTDGAGTIDAPDLRDRFVRGAAGDSAPAPTIQGALGGVNTVTLATTNLAAHTHSHQGGTTQAKHSHYVDANNAPHAHNSQAVNAPHGHNTGNINNNHTHPYSIYGLRYGEVPVTVYNGQSMAAYAHSFYYGGNTGNVNSDHSHGVNTNNAPHSHYVDASNAPHAHNSQQSNTPHSHTATIGQTGDGTSFSITNPYRALYYIMKI